MVAMPSYQRLCEDQRTSRRTIADAIEVLRKYVAFAGDDRATLWVSPFSLPSGRTVSLVDVRFAATGSETVFVVSLPTATTFQAKREGTEKLERFDISRLDGAVISPTANVTLAEGIELRALRVTPARLPYEPSNLDWLIVHHTVAIVDAEDRCYRNVVAGLGLSFDWWALDCSTLHDLTPPPLKVLASRLAERDPNTIGNLSLQKISDALATFGIRRPRPRPRRSRAA